MSRFKRWTSGVVSRVDWFVSQIENHEALAESAIAELQAQSAKARVQLERVRKDGAALRIRATEARTAAADWRERATRETEHDSALACLRRSKQAGARGDALDLRVTEHARIEAALTLDVGALRDQVGKLREEHNLMRTRESRAQALAAVHGVGARCEIDGLFERWEMRVTEAEVAAGCLVDDADELEAKYVNAEEQAALELELRQLRGQP